MFPCPHCGKILASAPALRNHIYIHTGEKPWSCDKCPATFRLYSTLYDHKKVSHVPNGKYKCTECPCRFAASLGLRRHTGIYHAKTNLDAISMDSQRQTSLKPNKGRVTVTVVAEDGTRTYPCHYCGKVFYKSQYLRNHYPVHTGERKSICNLCGVGFKSSSNLLSHKKVSHVEGGRHKCEKCPCVFASLLGLVRHRRLLHNIGKAGLVLQTLKRVKLRKAPVKLPARQVAQVSTHVDDDFDENDDDSGEQEVEDDNDGDFDDGGGTQDNEDESFECKQCGKILASAFGLRNHMYIHTGDKPWQCPDCGISFRLNSTLHGHRKVSHVPNGQFKCDECPCAFAAKFGLRRHKICFHDIQQPIVQFNKLKKRKLHQTNISQRTKQAKCEYCGMLFKNLALMNRHLLTHQDDPDDQDEDTAPDRPFPCSKCDCTYISRRSLRKHEKTAHVPGGKKCPKCSCSFLTSQARKSHHTKMHVKTDLTSLQSPQTRNRAQSSPTKMVSQEASKTLESLQEYGNDDASLKCPTCGKCFNSKPNLRQHLRIHSGQRYACEICHETFSLQSNMIRHKRTCHVERGPFKCSQCTHCYATTKGFKRHFAQAHGRRLGKSSESYIKKEKTKYDGMNITYHRPSTLASQKNRQPSKIKFNFQKPSLQNKQVEYYQPSRVRTSTTTVKKPLSKLMIKLITLIGGDSPTKTDLPEETESTSSWLPETSSPTSSSSGQPVCEICSKRFLNSHTLKAHMTVHTGERPWSCELCGQHFRQKGDIASHKKTNHAGNGKYKCAICPCRFVSIQGFKRHMMVIHNKYSQQKNVAPAFNKSIPRSVVKMESGPRPEQLHNKVTLKFANTKKTTVPQTRAFSCDLCSAAFNHLQNLTRHRKNSHVPSGAFKCMNCTCSFVSATSLRTHEAIFHQTEKRSGKKIIQKSQSSFPRTKQKKIPLDTSIDYYSSEELSRVPKIVTHGNKKVFLCELCGASFKTNANCSNHIVSSHVDGGQYACGQCPCIFSALKGLKRHEGIYHNTRNKNLKSQVFSNLKDNKIKVEHNNYVDEASALHRFEIYNDNDFEDYDERGRHLEIYNDTDFADEGEQGSKGGGQHYQDDGDWEEDEPVVVNNQQLIRGYYRTKTTHEAPSRGRGHKQVIFDKDFEDEEECLELHIQAEDDPLDTSSKGDDNFEGNENYDDDDDNFRNDPLRMVKLEIDERDDGDRDPLHASFHVSSEEHQQSEIGKSNNQSHDFGEKVQSNLKHGSSSSAHVFGKSGPEVNGLSNGQKRINRFIPANK